MVKRSKVSTGPDLGSLALTEEIIRMRAYHFFEERGYKHGHDLEDWLRAEAEIMGKKCSTSTQQIDMRQKAAA